MYYLSVVLAYIAWAFICVIISFILVFLYYAARDIMGRNKR